MTCNDTVFLIFAAFMVIIAVTGILAVLWVTKDMK